MSTNEYVREKMAELRKKRSKDYKGCHVWGPHKNYARFRVELERFLKKHNAFIGSS